MVEFSMPATLKLLLKDQWDIRATQRGVLVMEGGNTINAEIPAIKGDKGDRGTDGTPPRFHEPVHINELPNPQSLTKDDEGWIWPIIDSTTVYAYNGFDLVPIENWMGARGPVGPAPTVRIGQVQTSDIARVVAAQGTDGTVVLDIDLPRGHKGDKGDKGAPGDAAPISSALDYDDGGTPAAPGDVLTMREDGDWGPAKPQIGAGSVKKHGADSDWQAVNTGPNWKGDYVSLTTLTIPAQTFPWEPEVYGLVDVKVDGIAVRMDVEAHLGAVSGPLLALGPGMQAASILGEWTPRQLVPAADETAAFNASSSIVPAGQEATIHLIARRVESLSGITVQTRKERAYLRVNVNPVRVEVP
ncbi:hypothetical protein FOB82_10600 [Corynebacterium xerosis]|uniref:Uncharacterized protein n=1 Tax=Corynebacterium xerosis TaxID=1725 RepID=A0A6B8TI00_9CORY|nr:hypothetical protein [Corynebacterium xerosis]QGS35314.1 hypothetical protein FOB82_10600 [Corynebacterium xerosis]